MSSKKYAYKIKCPNPNETYFSSGGLIPRWTKVGKTWTSLQNLNAHIKLVDKYYAGKPYHPYNGATVFAYELKKSGQWKIVRTNSELSAFEWEGVRDWLIPRGKDKSK